MAGGDDVAGGLMPKACGGMDGSGGSGTALGDIHQDECYWAATLLDWQS